MKDNKQIFLKVFTDGGARGNPGPAAIGFVILNDKGDVLLKKGKYIGQATNNEAEYQAVIEALKNLCQNSAFSKLINDIAEIQFNLDSQLVVNQLNGLYKIKKVHLIKLALEVRKLEKNIKADIVYRHIPRENNSAADKILNQYLDKHS